MKTSVIVTGAGGNIGIHIAKALGENGFDVTATINDYRPAGLDARRLDITDLPAVQSLFAETNPGTVVNCAAIADANACQRDPDMARRVNIGGAANLAKACKERDAYLVHLSTDLVFDGARGNYSEADEARPISLYGQTKARSETVCLEENENTAVLRTAIVYGTGSGKRPNFFVNAARMARDQERFKIFTDEYRSFLYVEDCADAVLKLIQNRLTGTFHAGGAERLSRLDFVSAMLTALGLGTKGIIPIKISDLGGQAPRPADCSLQCSKLIEQTGWRPTALDAGLAKFKRALDVLEEPV